VGVPELKPQCSVEKKQRALIVQALKPILLIAGAIAVAVAGGIGCRAITGTPAHVREAAMAAGVGLVAAIGGLLPLQLNSDRSAVNLFQSAWIGSILHLTAFLAFGALVIFTLKPPTAFVVWLLAMYWLTLLGLCAVMVRTMRTCTGAAGSAQGSVQTKGK
jgi:hypothetical protein